MKTEWPDFPVRKIESLDGASSDRMPRTVFCPNQEAEIKDHEVRMMRYRFNDRPNWNRNLSRQIRKAGGDWLDKYPWRWYATLTFREDTSAVAAKALFKSFIPQFGPKLFYFLVIEQHKWHHSVHIHALMGGMFNSNPRPAMKSWFKLHGNAEIKPYDAQRPARFYIWKFLTNPYCDFDFHFPDESKGQPQLDVLPKTR